MGNLISTVAYFCQPHIHLVISTIFLKNEIYSVVIIYMMNNRFCSITLHELLYNNNMVSHKLSQIYKHCHCTVVSILLYEIRYDQQNHFWYNNSSIIDIFTLIKFLNIIVLTETLIILQVKLSCNS